MTTDVPGAGLDLVRTELVGVLDLLGADRHRAGYTALVHALADPDRRVLATGQGRSGLVVSMVAMRLMHLGRRAHVVGEPTAPSVRSGDTLLVVSGSARTPVSTSFARVARAEGARVVLVTGTPDGPLVDLADTTCVLPAAQGDALGGTVFEQCALVVLDAVVRDLAATVPDAAARLAHHHTNLQ